MWTEAKAPAVKLSSVTPYWVNMGSLTRASLRGFGSAHMPLFVRKVSYKHYGILPWPWIISGIFRQAMFKKDLHDCPNDPRNEALANFHKIQKIKSWMEIFGIGFLLLVPDIIFTIGRKFNGSSV